MAIQNIPESFIQEGTVAPDLFVYDYRMTADVVKSKVNLGQHLFSFLQTGHKKVHFGDTCESVNEQQSILIKKGNCLMTELLDQDHVYYCKLFFFSQEKLEEFVQKHQDKLVAKQPGKQKEQALFVIENDAYIQSFVRSLSAIIQLQPAFAAPLLELKFDEIMLYLLHKYGNQFLNFALSLQSEKGSTFRKTVEAYASSNLKLEEIAFLCNMSLSTFKRHFIHEYQEAPGKWLQRKRLHKAREMLQNGKLKPSEIYADFGYNNLSNFSIAFKNEFGESPSKC